MAYTGKKLNSYIWIPKAKSDLKEYRDILVLCREIEEKHGFFNDMLLGKLQVEKGAIFDGSLGSDGYFTKYEEKTIGNRSYVSSARMSIRLCRFFGWITRVPREKGKFKLTKRGRMLTSFKGNFPDKVGKLSELDLILEDVLNMRFYCVNDIPRYQNRAFKQRPMFNILRFLNHYEYLHNFEIVLSALSLKDESKKELKKAEKRLMNLRNRKLTMAALIKSIGINPRDKSSITGIYDGPKVLCSFLKQLRLLDTCQTASLGKKVVDYYIAAYKGSPFIKSYPRNVFKINDLGRKVYKEYCRKVPIWYEDLPNPKVKTAAALFLLKKGVDSKQILSQRHLKIKGIADFLNYIKGVGKENIIFDDYRDVPPEEADKYEAILHRYLKKEPEEKEPLFEFYYPLKNPKKLTKRHCILCYPYLCSSFPELLEIPNSLDNFASRVCPVDAIRITKKDGQIRLLINQKICSKCMFCYFRCPFNSIMLDKNGRIKLTEPPGKDIGYSRMNISRDEIFKKMRNLYKKYKLPLDIEKPIPKMKIIKFFEKKISKLGDSWNQDSFYVWVRNVLREMGLQVVYSGGKGMKTRSDVTVIAPFPAAIEVKSPSEGKVTSKAVRQTNDAAAQLFEKFQKRVYMCAVGQEISPEAKKKADEHKKYQESMGAKNYNIPLITSKVLLYLFLTHFELSFTRKELEALFRDYHGEFTQKLLFNYFKKIHSKRKSSQKFLLRRYQKEISALFSSS